jgi:hypothetical protein
LPKLRRTKKDSEENRKEVEESREKSQVFDQPEDSKNEDHDESCEEKEGTASVGDRFGQMCIHYDQPDGASPAANDTQAGEARLAAGPGKAPNCAMQQDESGKSGNFPFAPGLSFDLCPYGVRNG